MGVVVLLTAGFSLTCIVQRALRVPVTGSVGLFVRCPALHLFATTSMGIFMATIARSMPQAGLLMMLRLPPLQLLSGGVTPRESMPVSAQNVMLAAPTTHFVSAAQAILYRGAGLDVVWPPFLTLVAISAIFFAISLARFRKALSLMVRRGSSPHMPRESPCNRVPALPQRGRFYLTPGDPFDTVPS